MLIQAQICGIVLVLVIIILCMIQRKIDLRAQKLFRITLFMVLISIVLDASSILVIQKAQGDFRLFEKGVCKTYLASILGIGYCSLLYLTVELDVVSKKILRLEKYAAVYVGIGVMCIVFFPIYCHVEQSSIYTYGPSVQATYAFAIGFIVFITGILIRCKAYIHRRRRIVGLVWMGIWIAAALIQMFHNEFLLVGYASAIGVGILFMRLENPEGYLDRKTGLFNQQALQMYIKQNYGRYGNFSMMIVSINDGGYAGSPFEEGQSAELLGMISNYMDTIAKTVVFKNPGWEYTLLFHDAQSMTETSEKIIEKFRSPWKIKGKNIYINIRIFQVPDCFVVKNAEKLLELAHFFVSEGKKYTNRQVMVMDQSWVAHVQMKVEIGQQVERAIEEDRIQVYYQPIYSLRKGCYVSAEALVRIVNRDGSIMPPSQFIPVAEKNGAISQLGEIVFYKVCKFIKEEKPEEKGIQYLEINLSAVQCVQRDLAERFIQIMQEMNVKPAMINLEITESAHVKSKEILMKNMEKLQAFGVTFSLDDFGTGYSNLNYILELPVQIVKFDRKMTMSYMESEKGEKIMEAAIRMIQAMQMHIVAEGVEEKEQLDRLEQLNIDYIQGFYFSKPVPEQEFLKIIKKK